MRKHADTVRILLNVGGRLRKFCWIGADADQSIYFGGSIDKIVRWERAGTIRTSAAGPVTIHPEGGLAVPPNQRGGKTSLHASGMLLGHSRSDGRREERVIDPKRLIAEPAGLMTVIPMLPCNYPMFRVYASASDIVVDADDFGGKPFGVLLYIRPANAMDPVVSSMGGGLWPQSRTRISNLAKYVVGVITYRNSMFRYWPPFQLILRSMPDADGRLGYPMIGQLPGPKYPSLFRPKKSQ